MKKRIQKKQKLATAKMFSLEKQLRSKEVKVFVSPTLQESWNLFASILRKQPSSIFYINKVGGKFKLTDIDDKIILEEK